MVLDSPVEKAEAQSLVTLLGVAPSPGRGGTRLGSRVLTRQVVEGRVGGQRQVHPVPRLSELRRLPLGPRKAARPSEARAKR